MIDFKDARSGLSSIYSTFKRSNEKLRDVKKSLQEQNGYQLNKQVLNVNYFPIWGEGAGSYQADLMFLPSYKGVGICLCCINVNTRYAYVVSLRSKKQVYEGLKDIIDNANKDKRIMRHLQTDRGSEFNNGKVKELLSENDISYNYVNVADHAGQGKVERFNQTLRRLVNLYISANNNNNWVDALDDLVYNYNHRFHRKLGCAPIDANEQTEIVNQMNQFKMAQKDFMKFGLGDSVRVLKNKEVFDKGRKEWSTEIYKIEEIKGHVLKVDGTWYKHYQIQKVNGTTTDNDFRKHLDEQKRQHKIIRRLNKEGILNEGDVVSFRSKRERVIKFDKSLVGRRIDRGGSEKATITKYESDGPYHWFVKYDTKAKMKSEWMDENEIKQFLIK